MVIQESGVESSNLLTPVRVFSAVQPRCFAEFGRRLRLVHVPFCGEVHPGGVGVPVELQAERCDLMYECPGLAYTIAVEGYGTVY